MDFEALRSNNFANWHSIEHFHPRGGLHFCFLPLQVWRDYHHNADSCQHDALALMRCRFIKAGFILFFTYTYAFDWTPFNLDECKKLRSKSHISSAIVLVPLQSWDLHVCLKVVKVKVIRFCASLLTMIMKVSLYAELRYCMQTLPYLSFRQLDFLTVSGKMTKMSQIIISAQLKIWLLSQFLTNDIYGLNCALVNVNNEYFLLVFRCTELINKASSKLLISLWLLVKNTQQRHK